MTSGSTLGHYTIVQKLGSGGMGEVYLAEDTRLGRQVALKTLLPELSADAERRTRFEREARAVAALNHPGIVTLYSVESQDDVHFLTMELVKGRTLSQVIPPSGLSLKQFFAIALPLTDALGAAHEHGITHRDLKPENVMVSDSGRVKVLDFGLAKLKPRLFDQDEVTKAISDVRTMRGQVLGTIAYMSPEQAEGRELDHRSDIFSLGVLLHQMLTGQRPFGGTSTASILSSLLRDAAPPVTDLRADVPPRLARMIQRCLEKDPARRYQSVADLHADLSDIQQEITSGVLTLPAPAPRTGRGTYVVAAAIVAAAVAVYWLVGKKEAPASIGEVEVTQLTHTAGQELFPSLSPDGRTIVFASAASGNFDIYSQRVGGQNPLNLTKDSPADETHPAYSADGERIAFRSEGNGSGIFIAGATGESVRRVANFGYHPAWSPDGQRLAVVTQSVTDPGLRFTASELWIVTIANEERKLLTKADAAQPSWSPSGKRIAYWTRSGPTAAGDIWTIAADGGAPVAVTEDAALDWNPVWSRDGYVYFSSNRGGNMNLWRVPVDEDSGKPLGRPQAVTTGGGGSSQHVSISADGKRLAYVYRVDSRNLQHVAFDPVAGVVRGSGEWVTRSSRAYDQPAVSPDGRRLAFNSAGKQEDIFVSNIDGTALQQATDDPHKDRAARWSPDGRIAYYSDRTGAYEIWAVRPDGSEPHQLTRSPGAHYPVWSPDGRWMAYSTHSPNGAFIFDVTKPWDQQKPRPLPAMADPTLTFEIWGWSPNGRLLAGQKHLTDLSHAGIAIHEIGSDLIDWLTDFGEWPVWLKDNRRLLFSDQGKLFLIDSATRKHREVLSLPQQTLGSVGLSPDERTIYYTVTAAEADLWLITMK
jgi:Tol biopolymer transport system component/tRNA A-37 threonylcarbamoyl transferase component Bud32